MNFPSKLVALLLVLGSSTAMAKEASMTFFCTSVRLQPAIVRQLGFDYRLSVTTADDGSVNDELHLALDDSTSVHSHISGLRLELPPDPVFPDEPNLFEAALELDVPDVPDDNLNAISDLLEVSELFAPVSTSGDILYDDGVDVITGTATATWSKEAGSTTGVCRLRVKIPDLALDLTFNHTFEIFDYRGTLTYENVGTNVEATVNLTRQGADGEFFKGPLTLSVVDRDELTYDSPTWIGPGGLQFGILGTFDPLGAEFSVLRGGLFTNYFGLLYFADGNPATPFPDEYDLWQFDIRDGNDADGDGIPDLSDPPGQLPPGAPVAALTPTPGGLKLTITAKAGQQIVVEQQPALGPPTWEQIDARTLTADSEELDLPLPAEGARFYRVRTP